MKTFKGTASLDFKVVVTEQFIAAMREAAKSEDAGAFLSMAQAAHPQDDEAFIELVLRNGIRIGLRDKLLGLCAETHLGATVSPVKIEMIGVVPDHDADAVPQIVNVNKAESQAATGEVY